MQSSKIISVKYSESNVPQVKIITNFLFESWHPKIGPSEFVTQNNEHYAIYRLEDIENWIKRPKTITNNYLINSNSFIIAGFDKESNSCIIIIFDSLNNCRSRIIEENNTNVKVSISNNLPLSCIVILFDDSDCGFLNWNIIRAHRFLNIIPHKINKANKKSSLPISKPKPLSKSNDIHKKLYMIIGTGICVIVGTSMMIILIK
ncbi:hypothetical protein EBI_27484 [Enterocytozoon bieneusi H348]|nr:hypothetical protein EBI_27484 [Enterocytozoon bieneusi H348]|eukprot:XP_002649440.1 hypothetical protein EBI_27484 [Enterocytozoon bieneusi H348]